MTEPVPGVEHACRAIVRRSVADADGYRADVETVNGIGEADGRLIRDVPIDPGPEGRDGAGWFAPPKVGREVLVVWSAASGGHPVIAAMAPRDPAVPAIPVDAGHGSLQDGEDGEFRYQGEGKWHLIDGQGAEFSVEGRLWKLFGQDDMHATLQQWLDTLEAFVDVMIAAMTEISTTTDNMGHTGPIPKLPFDGATTAALQAVKAQVQAVREREAKVLRS